MEKSNYIFLGHFFLQPYVAIVLQFTHKGDILNKDVIINEFKCKNHWLSINVE